MTYCYLISLGYVFARADRSGYFVYEVEGAGLSVEEVAEREARGRGTSAGAGSGFERVGLRSF